MQSYCQECKNLLQLRGEVPTEERGTEKSLLPNKHISFLKKSIWKQFIIKYNGLFTYDLPNRMILYQKKAAIPKICLPKSYNVSESFL